MVVIGCSAMCTGASIMDNSNGCCPVLTNATSTFLEHPPTKPAATASTHNHPVIAFMFISL
jgi:hypothetical protein